MLNRAQRGGDGHCLRATSRGWSGVTLPVSLQASGGICVGEADVWGIRERGRPRTPDQAERPHAAALRAQASVLGGRLRAA